MIKHSQILIRIVTAVAIAAWSISPAIALETDAKNAIVMDAQTGVILFEKDADATMYPASMTKMMTAHMLFEALKSGDLLLTDTYRVSENAWRKGGSKMFVKLDDDIAVADLMRGIIIQSGNDACIVFSEGFAGSEERFAERMTKKAQEIGMKNTVFKNATGWPDEEHVTTARDLVTLAHSTITKYPEYYTVYAERDFTYNNIPQYNRNLLLGRNIGVDGLKTGHTEVAGYGITISGVQHDRRVHVVVGGLNSEKQRADEAEKLYRYAFTEFENVTPKGKLITDVPVWYGASDTVSVVVPDNAAITIPKVDTEKAKLKVVTNVPIKAPIKAGDVIGALHIAVDGASDQEVPLVAASDVDSASFVKRLVSNISVLISGNN